MSFDKILSFVWRAPPSRLVYSLLASYGERRGGALPGAWFVRMLEPLRVRPATIRQTLYRLKAAGDLEARRRGVHQLYRLTSLARVGTAAGTDRLLRPPETRWDGRWYIANYQFRTRERAVRNLVRSLLDLDGFAQLSRGTFIHPRDRTRRLLRALEGQGLADRIRVFAARRIGGTSDRELARNHWDVAALRAGYSRFIRRFAPLARRDWRTRPPHEALAARFAFVLSFLETAWKDPQLPAALLPADWPAARAQQLAAGLYRSLSRPLVQLGDRVLEEVGFTDLLARRRAARTSGG